MAIADDFSVAANGDIRYTGTVDNYSVLELHRFLQDLADDTLGAGDDLLDITGYNPSERSTDAIISLNDYSGIGGPTFNIDATAAEHLYGGSISQSGGDEIYYGVDIVGTVETGTQPQLIQNGAILTSYWSTGINVDASNNIISRMLILGRTGGADIDSLSITAMANEYGDTYSVFTATLSDGVTTLLMNTASDPNNQTAEATVGAYVISNSEGLQNIDCDGDGTDEDYYSAWNLGTQSVADFYEYAKWATRRGSAETLYGMSGELFRGVTHSVEYDSLVGTFAQNEVVTFGAGGTAQVLAFDGDTLWIQLLTGSVGADNESITGGTSGATADVNGTPTAKTVPDVFAGVLAGTNIVGAYGLGILATHLTMSDRLTDLDGNVCTPPNLQTFTVNGLVTGEDRILVGPEDGSGFLDFDQMSIATALTGATETAVVVSAAIPTDTPASGTIRVQTDGGVYQQVSYTSYTGSTFTIPSTDFSADNVSIGNNAFVSYLDLLATAASESFTSVVSLARTLFVRVRDGAVTPIKPFETTATLSTSGGSVSVNRVSDE